MPIEIKELHIRVAVKTSEGGQQSGPSGTSSSVGFAPAPAEKDVLVSECVEQVLQILRDKGER
ncbi:MAG: hypothetical protein D3916_04175 [Candidatus Electrothrix sp. MAN1_4]|nr:hypothetical protein [Candidatus Electrothrix sp. MAN1_4]